MHVDTRIEGSAGRVGPLMKYKKYCKYVSGNLDSLILQMHVEIIRKGKPYILSFVTLKY
jgi:hypothetical protein